MVKDIRDGVLYFDGCNTVELAQQYQTPLYVMSETTIVQKCNEIKEQFLNKYPNTRAAYASKAFSTKAMYKLCQREGLCIDVVSGGELYTAIQAGFPAEKIEFNGNNKLPYEIELAVDYGIGRFIVDGLQELALINAICKEKGKKASILFRITPGVVSGDHDYIVTGKKDSKFGIPLDDDVFYPQVEQALAAEHINFLGFHFHLGSQIHDNASYIQALDILLNRVTEVRNRYGFTVKELNLGGGFGARYTNEDTKPFSYFLDPLMARIESYFESISEPRPAIVIEPGRSIVAEAGMTLYTVGSIKDIENVRKYVSVDGGMTDNIRPALYQAVYDGVVANKADQEKTDKVTICGKCCESGDILITDIHIAPPEKGDIFAVFSTGAYGYSLASNYNKNPIPAVVLVKDGKSELIVKRQTMDDIIQNELIPDSLK